LKIEVTFMSTTIDAPGLAKISAGDRVRDLHNERQRKLRQLKRVRRKLAGLQVLKKDLQLYLQPGDYQHIESRLKAEVARTRQEEFELARRLSKERHAAFMAA
jgi:hypothetical protein